MVAIDKGKVLYTIVSTPWMYNLDTTHQHVKEQTYLSMIINNPTPFPIYGQYSITLFDTKLVSIFHNKYTILHVCCCVTKLLELMLKLWKILLSRNNLYWQLPNKDYTYVKNPFIYLINSLDTFGDFCIGLIVFMSFFSIFKLVSSMPTINKKSILYFLVVCFWGAIYYKKYKQHQGLAHISVLEDAMKTAIKGMDPILVEDIYATQVVSRVYEGLYGYHYLKRPLELVPNLAEAMPSISKDGLMYTIPIKKGVYFQDNSCFPDGKGRELKASDFIFSLQRGIDPANHVPFRDFIQKKIKGLDAWSQSHVLNYNEAVDGIKALDDYTLQFTLTAPFPQFLDILAHCISYVVPKEAVAHYGKEFMNHPVGTGPFTLPQGFNPQDNKIEFVKNPTFRVKLFPDEAAPEYQHMLSYAGKGLPLVDKMITHIMTEEETRWLKIQKGGIDIIPLENGSSLTLTLIEDNKLIPKYVEKELVLYEAPAAGTETFCFNHKHDLFGKNILLRKAMSMAFDREAYAKLFFKNTTIVAKSILSPDLPGYSHDLVSRYGYNLEQAKRYLAQAGYPAGKGLPVITLDIANTPAHKNRADFFAKCMDKIGIKIEVIPNIFTELTNKMSVKGSTMMHMMCWVADYPDASSILQVIKERHLLGLNYVDNDFNALYEKALKEPNIKNRWLLYGQLNQIVADKVPLICSTHLPITFIHSKRVDNYAYDVCNLTLDQYLAVDTAKDDPSTA